MNKNKCKVGQNVVYFPNKQTAKFECGVVTEVREDHAMVLYDGDTISKATYYRDIEVEPETLIPVGTKNENS